MGKLNISLLQRLPGRGFPLGATVGDEGVHFAMVSRHATRVWLAVFADKDDTEPLTEFEFDPARNRIGDVWSMFVKGLRAGVFYLYRVDGPYEPENGHRFDSNIYLLDPHAKIIVGSVEERRAKCMIVDEEREWTPYVRPRTSKRDTIVYEVHVRGLTAHPSAMTSSRGTYLGLIEKIPYLKELGVTAVELMPVQEVGEEYYKRYNPDTNEQLKNYWGYAPIGFMAPAARFGSLGGVGEQLREFREMVAKLHEAGIEVIMDVVFNHTAEGQEDGPAYCFRGIDHATYYLLNDRGACLNYTGCGNTFNCNHPIARDLILDSLRYWTTVMRVDGFRFDLASVLGRDRKGRLVENAPVIERIAEDPVLRDVKLIAEAWDVGGAYQVGSFGSDPRWAELNGQYRDDVRRYWLCRDRIKGRFALRLTGSPDLYQDDGRNPTHSVNFVASHDGFTLRDLVSYNHKHNEANGENNRDGLDHNFSWNCGVEGETTDVAVNALRLRMQKNLLGTLFMSLGVPMLLGGDEFGRTQRGNNNAYCQDSEISWHDWAFLRKNRELFEFCREMIRFRRSNPVFERDMFFTGEPTQANGKPDILWFNSDGHGLDWNNEDQAIALWINGSENNGVSLYAMFNPGDGTVPFRLVRGDWQLRIDTARHAPEDISRAGSPTTSIKAKWLDVKPHSLVVLSSID